MAITILNTPPAYVPVYNPIYTKVSSDQTAQEGFNFLFDLYVNGAYVTRTNLLPRPGTTQTIYSPARILESYVNYDLTHNIVTDQVSTNCIDKYKIVYGEEYVVYWSYDSIEKDTITNTSFTILTSTTPHGYAQYDQIVIKQNPGFTYPRINGIHQVSEVFDAYTILINVTWPDLGTVVIEGGRTTWSDKRKTEFIGNEIILANGTDYSKLADWSYYGPDGCAVQAGIFIDDTITLVVPDVSCGTAFQIVEYAAISPAFIPGRTYAIEYTITANDPSGEGWNVYSDLGGNSVVHNFDGFKSDVIVCGAGTPALKFGLNLTNADTGGFGTHSLKISDLFVTELPQSFEGYDWNAVVSYEDVPTFDYTRYQMDGASYFGQLPKFLTKQPLTVLTRLEDRGSIGWLNILDHSATPNWQYFMLVAGYNLDGTPRLPLLFELPTMEQSINPSDPSNRIIEFPAYPWNLNQASQAYVGIDVIDNTVGKYFLQLYKLEDPIGDPNNYIPISEQKYFELDHTCSRFTPVRFMFKNSLGQFDYFNATMLSRTTLNISRDTYTKTLGMDYQVGDRGRTVINVNSQESYIANTDWISETTANWLVYEMANSSEVYVLNNDGSLMPVITDIGSIEPKKQVNDQLFNYTFSYSKAVNINTTRG